MGKLLKTIVASASFSLFLYCLGCGSSLQQGSTATPSITQVLPQAIPAGSEGATVTVKGTNFPSQAVILWNGAALTTTTVDTNTLTGSIGSSSLAMPSTVQLKVQNRKTMEESSPAQVTITDPNAAAPSALRLAIGTLPQGVVGGAYNGNFSATGGTSPYTWNIASGQLPPGLNLGAGNGVVSGTPSGAGNYSFQIKVTDASSLVQSATTTVSLPVISAPATATMLTIGSSSLPSGTIGTTYSAALESNGGTTPYTWSVTTGNLPAGLSLDSATGLISGTPTAIRNSNFTVTVRDAGNPAQTVSVKLSIAIAGAKQAPLSVSMSSLPSGTMGTPYSSALQAAGGTSPYTWSIISGGLPAGLSLASSTGLVSGTPTASGNFSIGVTVKDAGSPAQTTTGTVTLSIVQAGTPLAINTASLPGGAANASYSTGLNATGGSGPYTWSINPGSLPPGLTLGSTTGVVSGTPTAGGNFTVGVTVRDASSPVQSATAMLALSIAAPPPLVISTTSLSGGIANESFSTSLNASGGTTPYTWSLAGGTLPAGLSLGAASGAIAGTPTAAGTASLMFNVADSSSPVQTKSVTLSLTIAAQPLTISASFPEATENTAYSSPIAASGGTPAYSWSITAGSLPPGLSLAATSGVISGTPTGSGTYNFTATVSDNGSPLQAKSASTSIVVASAPVVAGPGATWFVRADGGTRYSSNMTSGQCDGLADVGYSGSGTNQHCAFKDIRYLWDDGSGLVWTGTWVIAGGDTVVIRGCSANANQLNPSNPNCRIGWDIATGGGPTNPWCGNVGSYTCYNPPIPAGTATQHTRILGACAYGTYSCTPVNTYPLPSNNLTQIFGGFGLVFTFNLGSTSYVDIEGIELTTHNGVCVTSGSPAYPRYCSTGAPLDDYASNGFKFDNKSSNIALQDVYVHGFNSSGLYGPIGGTIELTRVFSGFSGFSGWNFQDNTNTPNGAGSSIKASYVTMIGNGCYEQYPIVNKAFPAQSCYDDVSNGFGDSWSGQDTDMDAFSCDHCVMMYNTKDGFIGPHAAIGTLTITNSASIGNMGQQWKWGTQINATTLFQNNLTVGNCSRMSAQLPGAAQNFAKATGLPGSYLSDFCRAAGDTIDILMQVGSKNYFYGNTIVMADSTGLDLNCGPAGGGATNCGSVVDLWENNNFLGYSYPGDVRPGLWYIVPGSNVVVTSAYNNESGVRNGDICGTNHITCADPLLVNEPALPWSGNQADLDVFNPFIAGNSFTPSSGSPLRGAGISVTGLTTDYNGATRSNPPSIGAVEP